MIERSSPSRAETRLAEAVGVALRDQPVGVIPPPADVLACLERLVPEVLAREYPEWAGEGLDGIDVARCWKVADRGLGLLGTGILVSDQRVTPLLVEVQASARGIASYAVRLGEPGVGPLRISGPPCNSGAASRLLHRLASREELGRVEWVYVVMSESFAGLG